MPGFMENPSTLSSFFRTILAVGVLGGLGSGGWFAYSKYYSKEQEAQENAQKLADATKQLEAKQADLITASKTIKEKEEKIIALNKDIEKLQTRLALLKVDHRLARLTVVPASSTGARSATGVIAPVLPTCTRICSTPVVASYFSNL